MYDLSLQVVELDFVEVSQAQGADSGCRQVEGYRTAQSARSDDENVRVFESLLSGYADFVEEDMSAVASKFRGAERVVCRRAHQ